MNRVIENFLSSHRYAARTKVIYRPILEELITIPDLDQLDATGLINFITRPGWGNASQNVALFSSRKFLKWLYGSLHPALSATIPRIKPKPRRSLDPDKALQVLASFDPFTPAGARDLTIIAFGLDTRYRRQELCDVMLADIDFYSYTASVICKGGQWGYGAFSEETAAIIQRWLAYRKPADGVGNLFVSLKTGKALTGDGMNCIFKRLSKSLGFRISAHDLCSSFATLATIFGAPSRTVQEAGRWKDIEMVEHYTGTLRLDAIRKYLPLHNIGNR